MNPRDFEHLAAALPRHLPTEYGLEPRLEAALRQLTTHPGKLFRAVLVYEAARRFGVRRADAERLACAVEYFHVASLVLDDLPCMDDAAVRRGLPCVHRQHGEATAILASLALINRAYALIGQALAGQTRRVREEAGAVVDRSLGLAGLVGGQAWDLAFGRTERSASRVSRIAAAKTGALLSLAVLLPAALARPSAQERKALRALCVYWGQLFQIADDVRDVLATSFEAGKTTGRDRALARPNLALALGLPAAQARLARLQGQAARMLAVLARQGRGRWQHLVAAAELLAPALEFRDRARSAA
ncbi:MAG: polyprenyl synthetase family protein [Verrucomicrobia bacterium]|nr:polyprenyl synthetase family protein [Verrucomicrobiota bacterium]